MYRGNNVDNRLIKAICESNRGFRLAEIHCATIHARARASGDYEWAATSDRCRENCYSHAISSAGLYGFTLQEETSACQRRAIGQVFRFICVPRARSILERIRLRDKAQFASIRSPGTSICLVRKIPGSVV